MSSAFRRLQGLLSKFLIPVADRLAALLADGVDVVITSYSIHYTKLYDGKGAKLSVFPVSEQKRWTAKMPNIAGEWAKGVEAKGLPAKQITKFYIDAVRKKGGQPVRDWDKEL